MLRRAADGSKGDLADRQHKTNVAWMCSRRCVIVVVEANQRTRR